MASCNSGHTHRARPSAASRAPCAAAPDQPSPRLWRAACLSHPTPTGATAALRPRPLRATRRRKCGSEVGRCEPRAEMDPPPSFAHPAEAGETTPNDRALTSPPERPGTEMGRRVAASTTVQFDRLGDAAPRAARPPPGFETTRTASPGRDGDRSPAPRPLAERPPLPFPPPLVRLAASVAAPLPGSESPQTTQRGRSHGSPETMPISVLITNIIRTLPRNVAPNHTASCLYREPRKSA